MNGTRTQLALCDTLDNRLRTHLTVAPGKDSVAIRHIVMWIGLNRRPLGPFNS